ncbi:hypothetical protein RJ40_00825 [Methanofollis aquaemaris]|uniref:Uncharacterized protein n=1 Tax=Methanofollis aquaemaris TaxID=126734 RepID=A0A8A3S1E4_9EURY|nr:hypothetical protein [Methanofollis aquaemaris]QSZ66145.1 hypothetical protein RJ40_00825 [Methanofollis aquaemaris]
MSRKNDRLAIIIFGIIIITVAVVGATVLLNESRENENDAAEIAGHGTMKYIDLEGGFYGIIADDGKQYLPLHFRGYIADDTEVDFKANVSEKTVTIQQWGTPVEIISLERTGGPMQVSELLQKPVYETPVTIYGTVSRLYETFSPTFILSSGRDASVTVWYGLTGEGNGQDNGDRTVNDDAVDKNESLSPSSIHDPVAGIENGDLVVVRGVLKQNSQTGQEIDFWMDEITLSGPPGGVDPARTMVEDFIRDSDEYAAHSGQKLGLQSAITTEWYPTVTLYTYTFLARADADSSYMNLVTAEITVTEEKIVDANYEVSRIDTKPEITETSYP